MNKGRQENAQRQDMKGTNEASKEGLKGRPGNLKKLGRWARNDTKVGKERHKGRQGKA